MAQKKGYAAPPAGTQDPFAAPDLFAAPDVFAEDPAAATAPPPEAPAETARSPGLEESSDALDPADAIALLESLMAKKPAVTKVSSKIRKEHTWITMRRTHNC